jgi:hypothetical protein
MIEIVIAIVVISLKFILSVVILKTLPFQKSNLAMFRYFLLITIKNLIIFAIVIYFIQQSQYDKNLFYIALFISYILYLPFELNYTRKFFKIEKKN